MQCATSPHAAEGFVILIGLPDSSLGQRGCRPGQRDCFGEKGTHTGVTGQMALFGDYC